ncbi:MBOAT family O-acyltransferase [Rubellicoccus peritrichatus]|uniref:MBOAT family O-acyltransferase n=1 Tax=Rubellicoccus peritrichatus TaxID=3080537 RepID=A0AAQ3LE97_9BACT|nr:MBOAT family O-acyltransferase [Puniceicoccus sp. CR14]WOO42924.1 MBOAT family O-acyltransferase [Puniceicoccus sp. CR14]
MLFNSSDFFVFFGLTVCGFFLIGRFQHRIALGWLVLCSLLFYGWWNPPYLILIVASLVFNYFCGWHIYQKKARMALWLGVSANLLTIAYFKYYDFFLSSAAWVLGNEYRAANIILPLGISFFTFQQIAYLVDAYHKEAGERNFLNYSLFVSFFPQLIAGPIVHHQELLPQFRNSAIFKPQKEAVYTGLTIFFLGLFKKVVVADGVAPYANAVFDHADMGGSVSFFEAWGGALAYTVQLYFDFSGYSDMAIGLACVLNIRLPMNFNSPYRKASIIEFWRSWHMTLSCFLRDYLYIPLGGGRRGGKVRRYGNLMITMLVGGLWHGAAWNFVFWGGLHGLYLLINHAWRNIFPKRDDSFWLFRHVKHAVYWVMTFVAVCVAWVFFRALTFSGAFEIIKGMAGLNGFILPKQIISFIPAADAIPWLQSQGTMVLLGGGSVLGFVEQSAMTVLFLIVALFSANLYEISGRRRALLLMLTFAFTIQRVFFSPAPSEFIYFQF